MVAGRRAGSGEPGVRTRRRAAVALLLPYLAAGLALPAAAVTVPVGFTHATVAHGLTTPTSMAFAPDGRLFVTEQGGALRVVKDGRLLPTPFLTVDVDHIGERGLLGVTVDPDFATNHYVYAYYTTTTPVTHNRISRFVGIGDRAQRLDGSLHERVLMDLPKLPDSSKIHNGGALHFGPDGKLYVGVGDASTGDNAQSLETVFGKILRLNPDGSIPGDNPFRGRATGQNGAIWAMGLRNPFTFDFEPGGSRMLINDVGQNTWEEIDAGVAGGNYGWPVTEGPSTDSRYLSPVYAYRHDAIAPEPSGCAITGGAFYDPPQSTFPEDYRGSYLFGDFCSHWIKRLDVATGKVTSFVDNSSQHPVDLRVGPQGDLYYLALGTGDVERVGYNGSAAPTVGDPPDDTTVGVGETAHFAVSATGVGLSYQWMRNGAAIAGARRSSLDVTRARLDEDGAHFYVVVTNAHGSATSPAGTLHVVRDQLPVAVIDSPAEGSTFDVGQTIPYVGHAQDPEDGTEPAAAFTWTIDLLHGTHAHPFLPATKGIASGSFFATLGGHTEKNIWFHITMTVKDKQGRVSTVTRDVYPRTGLVRDASPQGALTEGGGSGGGSSVVVASLVAGLVLAGGGAVVGLRRRAA
jgi:glucose/arabinose dehydrogenase